VHPILDGENATMNETFNSIRAPLLLNSALAAVKLNSGAQARLAVEYTTRAIDTFTLSDADKGWHIQSFRLDYI
jgi:peptidyl-prolyl isomerase D